MGERRSSYRSGGSNSGKSWRPPRSDEEGNLAVPLWEKRFCIDACGIPWKKLVLIKRFMSFATNVHEWDDSGALEAFNDAKARFWAYYHGQPCYIPLPDPYMYIDEVNQNEHVDPKLVDDLETCRHVFPEAEDPPAECCVWDPGSFLGKPVPATGWGDEDAANIPSKHCSTNWNNHVEQPQPVQTSHQQISENWNDYIEEPVQTSSWGDSGKNCPANWGVKADSADAWKPNYGRGQAAGQPGSWGNQRDGYYGSDSQKGSSGHWKKRNNDSGRRNGRARDGGGRFGARAMKPKYNANDHHDGSNNGWRNHRERNNADHYPNDRYANYSFGM